MNYEIVCIYLKNGRNAVNLSGQSGACDVCVGSYEPYAILLGCQNSGDRGILIFDLAEGEEEQKVNAKTIGLLCRDSAIPIYTAATVKTPEDIQTYLDLGCERVFLNFRTPCSGELLKESAARFGKDKLGFYADRMEDVTGEKELLEQSVSALLLEPDAAAAAEQTGMPVLFHKERQAVCLADHVPSCVYQSSISWEQFKKNSDGLVPVVVQDYRNKDVLMVAYMNQEAFETTCRTGRMTYWSRSRQELWVKGLTSGHFQFVKSLTLDCDNDTILAQVAQIGAACHTGHRSCFFQPLIRTDGKSESGQ